MPETKTRRVAHNGKTAGNGGLLSKREAEMLLERNLPVLSRSR
jgi:hypothetical protein